MQKEGNQAPVKRVDWKCHLKIGLDENTVTEKIWLRNCLVLATNLAPQELDEWAVLDTYKAQSGVEPGLRFIKSQTFFAEALFWKKPAPIEGLLRVRSLSLRV